MDFFNSRGNVNPFAEMGMGSMGASGFGGLGGGFGGGFDRLGSNIMGLNFSDHDGHMRHSADIQRDKGFLNGFAHKNGFGQKKE